MANADAKERDLFDEVLVYAIFRTVSLMSSSQHPFLLSWLRMQQSHAETEMTRLFFSFLEYVCLSVCLSVRQQQRLSNHPSVPLSRSARVSPTLDIHPASSSHPASLDREQASW